MPRTNAFTDEELKKAWDSPFATTVAVAELFGVSYDCVKYHAGRLGLPMLGMKMISCNLFCCETQLLGKCCINCRVKKDCKNACNNNPIVCKNAEIRKVLRK